MTAVDEQQSERCGPEPPQRRSVSDRGDHVAFEAGVEDRPAEQRQRVHAAHCGIDEVGFVPLPTRLVLLGPAVVVDGEHDGAGGTGGIAGEQHHVGVSCSGTQVDAGLAAVAADLEERSVGDATACVGAGSEQGEPLVGWHEAASGFGSGAKVGIHRHAGHQTGKSRCRSSSSSGGGSSPWWVA